MPIVVILSILLIGAFMTGLIFLQIYLSKREDNQGLILPLILGIITVFTSSMVLAVIVRGDVFGGLLTLILINVPFVLCIVIYKNIKTKQNAKNEIDKMIIQDLS
jgi:hypothetical protein